MSASIADGPVMRHTVCTICGQRIHSLYLSTVRCEMEVRVDGVCPGCTENTQQFWRCLHPDTTTEINVNFRGLTELPDLRRFRHLKRLRCSFNQLTALPPLPDGLEELHCNSNLLTALPAVLPPGLQILHCKHNRLTEATEWPPALLDLDCSQNELTALSATLPPTLKYLDCSKNRLVALPSTLPRSLVLLRCQHNQLVALPPCTRHLPYLYCHHNQLRSLPATFNRKLRFVKCCHNQLTQLPPLPKRLFSVYCSHNRLETLPVLTASEELTDVFCDHNRLAWVPPLPPSLQRFHFHNNPVSEALMRGVDPYYPGHYNAFAVHDNEIICEIDPMLHINIDVLLRFRALAWAVRLRDPLRRWLWERVRRPRIEAAFVPGVFLPRIVDASDDFEPLLAAVDPCYHC